MGAKGLSLRGNENAKENEYMSLLAPVVPQRLTKQMTSTVLDELKVNVRQKLGDG